MIILGPSIPVYVAYRNGKYLTAADFNVSDRYKMYHFKRDILLNVLNVQITTNSGEIICTDMKRVCGFSVSHIVTHYYAASHRVAWSVGLTVTLSVCHTSEYWKKRLKRSNYHLRSGLGWAQWTTYYMTSRGQHGKGQFWVGNRQTIVMYYC